MKRAIRLTICAILIAAFTLVAATPVAALTARETYTGRVWEASGTTTDYEIHGYCTTYPSDRSVVSVHAELDAVPHHTSEAYIISWHRRGASLRLRTAYAGPGTPEMSTYSTQMGGPEAAAEVWIVQWVDYPISRVPRVHVVEISLKPSGITFNRCRPKEVALETALYIAQWMYWFGITPF